MPRSREVLTLQALALYGIGEVIARLARMIINKVRQYSDQQKSVAYLRKSLTQLENLLLSHVPHYLYDAVAVQVLLTVKNLICTTKRAHDVSTPTPAFFTEMNFIVNLTEVILTPHLKQLEFSVWPKTMRCVLYKNLYKLSGLEELNLGSCAGGWRSGDNDTSLIDGIRVMKNLRSLCLGFDCNDGIIQTLGNNCKNLRSLDITSSRSVTDRSVGFLLKCKRLIRIQLYRTSVTKVGFTRLLVGLPKLQDVGRCDDFGKIINYIYTNSLIFGPLALRKFQTRYLSPETLKYLVTMCPKVEHIGLFHDGQVTNFTELIKLHNLKELKLSSCGFYTDSIKQFLEARGSNIFSLHLEYVDEIDLHAIMLISQCCPLLKTFILYNCGFVDQRRLNPILRIKPYEYLERLFWVVDCSVNHLEFILTTAINIKFIHLGSSTDITHSSIVQILASNPLKNLEELRILYSSDMNMRTIGLLLENCSQLKVLSELESWQGISLAELKSIRKFIYFNNYNLDISPTLSY